MDLQDITQVLQSTPLFSATPEADLRMIAGSAEIVSFKLGETILRAGDEGSGFFILQAGKVRVLRDGDDGKQVTLAVLKTGAAFGERSLLFDQPVSATIRSAGKTTAIKIGRDRFLDLVARNPNLRESVAAALARQVVARRLSVRETEKLAKIGGEEPGKPPRRSSGAAKPEKDADTRALEGDLSAALGMKVVIDCANGAAYHVAPSAIWELGAEIVTLGVEPNGTNINRGVGSTALDAVKAKVVEVGADIGIALDGDADRLIVDKNGLSRLRGNEFDPCEEAGSQPAVGIPDDGPGADRARTPVDTIAKEVELAGMRKACIGHQTELDNKLFRDLARFGRARITDEAEIGGLVNIEINIEWIDRDDRGEQRSRTGIAACKSLCSGFLTNSVAVFKILS